MSRIIIDIGASVSCYGVFGVEVPSSVEDAGDDAVRHFAIEQAKRMAQAINLDPEWDSIEQHRIVAARFEGGGDVGGDSLLGYPLEPDDIELSGCDVRRVYGLLRDVKKFLSGESAEDPHNLERTVRTTLDMIERNTYGRVKE